jgi:hypothetical protein
MWLEWESACLAIWDPEVNPQYHKKYFSIQKNTMNKRGMNTLKQRSSDVRNSGEFPQCTGMTDSKI